MAWGYHQIQVWDNLSAEILVFVPKLRKLKDHKPLLSYCIFPALPYCRAAAPYQHSLLSVPSARHLQNARKAFSMK